METTRTDEETLCRNQITLPTLQKFDGSVDASDDNAHNGEYRCRNDGLHFLLSEHTATTLQGSHYNDIKQDTEDDDGGELEKDSRDHDVRAIIGVSRRSLLVSNSSRCTSDCLHNKRYNVRGTENVQVHVR